MRNPIADANPPEVVLVFPPLVELSFGAYYPSTAVLASWLEQHNVPTMQMNLNDRFADYLLTDQMLTRLGEAAVPGLDRSELPAAFARWAMRERHRLVGPDGRKLFNARRLGYVIAELAKPFLVDPGREVLNRYGPVDQLPFPLDTHRDFLDWSGLCREIPPSIRILGLSVAMGPQLAPALLLAAAVKEVRPELRIVAGGPALSLMNLDDLGLLLRQHTALDAVVRFDGEGPLLALATQCREGRWDPLLVPGVSARRKPDSMESSRGDVEHVPPTAGPQLDKLTVPLYADDILDGLTDPVLSVTQARGCYWGKCDYCDFIELYDGSPPYRGRRPEVVFREIEELVHRHDVRRFTFITESIPPAFARRLSRRLIESGTKIRWESFAMVDRRFDRELLALMREAGCELLVVGMETMTTRVLKLVHKSADRVENLRFLRDAHDVGLHVSINIIPDLPSTTYAEAVATLEDLERVSSQISSMSIFPFEATRSSEVGRSPERFGLVPAVDTSAEGQAQYRLNHLSNIDPAMTADERAEIHRRFKLFAQQLNRRNAAVSGTDGPLVSQAYRMPAEDLDVFDGNTGRVTLTNVIQKSRVSITSRTARLLAPFMRGEAFTQDQLAEAVGEATAASLLENLADCGLLAPVSGRYA